ncbi:hypothetical protein PROVRETT_05980 [Providencia rettgeri DSM 1131]|nr:hypothetical protein PROVRETT_05980 [Providencia rettgeri DSM 1131]
MARITSKASFSASKLSILSESSFKDNSLILSDINIPYFLPWNNQYISIP